MKKKDIISVVISAIVIIGCGYYVYNSLFPTKAANVAETKKEEQVEAKFTGEIDNETLDSIKKLKDYGEAPLDNVGRANPFGPL